MKNSLSNLRLVRKDRWKELLIHEYGYYDMELVRAAAPEHRNRLIDLMDRAPAQVRQDLFVLLQLEFKQGGFFVEFGATDGRHLNNTWLMESEFGWTGILAEPARSWHDDLRRNRAATIDTRCVWKKSGDRLKFTEAPRGENSGLSPFVSSSRRLRGTEYEVETISLNDLLASHNAPAVIDYLSVDTEGSEFDILNAVDFDRWSFRTLTVEHDDAPQRADIYNLLTSHGYRRVFENISRFDDFYIKD